MLRQASDLRETSLPESRAVDRAENYSLLSCMFCVTWAVAQTLVWERAVLQVFAVVFRMWMTDSSCISSGIG